MRPASISFLIEAASLEVDRSVRGRVYICLEIRIQIGVAGEPKWR
jgi:hypothetical protein